MARLARSTILGFPHHVVQRGNYDQPVFESEADYRRYLSWLQEYTAHYAVDVWAYCLMPNHVHFICVPKAEEALARAFNTLHMRYAQYFNGKRSLRGHLWRARFMSCVLDESSVREEVRFVENNPVRIKLVERAEDYAWSSARSHVTGEPDPILSDGCLLTSEIPNWREYLMGRGEEDVVKRVRERLKTGRPAGDAEFVHRLEEIVGRRLEALPRGRPRKEPQRI
jgi:putative transposase